MTLGGCYDYRICSRCSVRVLNVGISHFLCNTRLWKLSQGKTSHYVYENKQTNKKNTPHWCCDKERKNLHLCRRNASVSFTINYLLSFSAKTSNISCFSSITLNTIESQRQESHKVIMGFQTFLRISHGLALKGVVWRLSSSFVNTGIIIED